MNAGLFGMSSGQAVSSRKLAGQVSNQSKVQLAVVANAALSLGRSATNTVSLSIGVRTKLVGVNGKGAVRFVAVSNDTGSTETMNIEVVIDGVSSSFAASVASGFGLLAVGSTGAVSTSSGAVMDYLPFDSSAEIFITSTIAGQHTPLYVIDLHQ